MTTPAPTSAFASDPAQPLAFMTRGDLQHDINAAVYAALAKLKEHEEAERRIDTKEAAALLGCTTGQMQRHHRRGLAYEKGVPNRYRLGDVREYRETFRLDLQPAS